MAAACEYQPKPFPLREPLVWIGAAIIAIAFAASDGLFIIDELIYFLGTNSLIDHGSLTVQTGYDQFHSSGLRLLFLIEGAHGLVPQYPPGYSVLTAPFVVIFGTRGFILLNAIATVATAFIVRTLTRELFTNDRAALAAPYLFLLGTFSLEYAYGIWPQMLSAFIAMASLLCFARSLDATGWRMPAYSSGAGMLIGLGMLIRLDALLLVPAFLAFHVLETRRPVRPVAALLLGLLPAIALLSGANSFKFGTLNPLSYGSSGGSTDLAAYRSLLALLPLGIAGLLLIRWARRRSFRLLPAAGLGAAIVVSAWSAGLLGGVVGQCLSGAYALLVDITRINPADPFISARSDGTALFFGMPKKALAQSLPWLGILPLLILDRNDARRTRSIILLLLVCAFWIAPFALRSWYGGMASNMRYLLPIVPVLCVLSSHGLCHVLDGHEPARRPLLWTYIAGIAMAGVASFAITDGLAKAEQIYTLYLFLLLLALCVVFTAPVTKSAKAWSGKAALHVFAVCAGVSTFWGAVDLMTSQMIRHSAAASDEALNEVAGPLLVIGRAERFPSIFAHYPAKIGSSLIAGCKDTETSCATLDFGMIASVQKHGYKVLLYRPALTERIRNEIRERGLRITSAAANPTVNAQFVQISR